MKKIMFNDRWGLTQAVLDGRKTVTRRLIPQSVLDSVASSVLTITTLRLTLSHSKNALSICSTLRGT